MSREINKYDVCIKVCPCENCDYDESDCELAKAYTKQLTNRWIPISESWPDKNGHYLVTCHEWTDGNYLPKYDEVYIKIFRYQEAVFRLPVCCDKKAENDTHREVIAWQPLPEPYKEANKDA